MNNSFKKLLESVKERCPDIITEEVYTQLSNDFDNSIAKITADATQEGQAIGFKDGYEEGKRVAAEQAKAEYEKLIEKLDTDAVEKLTSIISMIDEDHTQKLQELYDFFKETTVPRKEMEEELNKQDELHAEQLQKVYEAIDNDHAKKLQIIKEAIDNDHAKKLQIAVEAIDKNHTKLLEEAVKTVDEENTKKLEEVVDLLKKDKDKAIKTVTESVSAKFNKQINDLTNNYENKIAESVKKLEEEKNRKLDILAENVEKYLNYALETNIPKKDIISEQKYNAMARTVDKIIELLNVNSIIQESKDEIFKDYENQIAKAKEETNKLINEKIELINELNKKEAQIVLESKIQKCPPIEARFLREYFKKATSPKIIEESIEEARASFKRIQAEKRSILQAEAKKVTTSIPSKVVTESSKEDKKESVKQIVSEQKDEVHTKDNDDNNLIDMYAKYLTKNNK